jgi:type VI secretion system secreted protein Hcp
VHSDKIAAVAFSYEVTSPRDVATGQASGRRQHGPVTFVKAWGAASPQPFQALTTNEVLKSVLFEFVGTNSNGEEEVQDTIKLTNATISRVRRHVEAAAAGDREERPLDEVALVFQKIELTNTAGKTMATDDWTTRV